MALPQSWRRRPSGVDGNGPKRFSVQFKMAIVARLLRGEPLELVARHCAANSTAPEEKELVVIKIPLEAP
jgi:hypothetical protein